MTRLSTVTAGVLASLSAATAGPPSPLPCNFTDSIETFLPEEQDAGYTLFSPDALSTTFLVDNTGGVVHEWAHSGTPGQKVRADLAPRAPLSAT